MNKSNGSAQRKQRDTIIPQSNLDAHFWGQPQKMTMTFREAKGWKAVLEFCLTCTWKMLSGFMMDNWAQMEFVKKLEEFNS